MSDVKKFVLGDKVVLNGKEGEVKAVSPVVPNAPKDETVVEKYTVGFPDGSKRQYVPVEDLQASVSEVPVVAAAPEAEVKEEASAVDEAPEAPETPEEEVSEAPEGTGQAPDVAEVPTEEAPVVEENVEETKESSPELVAQEAAEAPVEEVKE